MSQIIETPQKAAQRLAAGIISKGYKPEALHTYTDKDGKPLHWRIRLKDTETGEKWIRPMKLNGAGYVLGEPEYPNCKPLYRLHTLAARATESVMVVEGESCADALLKLGILSTTSGAADSAGKADWQPLAGRTVTIWPDNDKAGERYAIEASEKLQALGCSICWMDIAALNLPPKGDAVDFLKQHPNATAADIWALQTIPPPPCEKGEVDDSESDEESEGKRPSQASALVAFVESKAELFHDQNANVYAQDRETKETRRIDGRQLRDWLLASYYQSTGKSARDQALREALSTLSGLGRFQGECCDVYVRVAAHDGCYYLDLAEPGKNRAVRIEAGKWEIADNPPVRFIRPETMRPLPTPEPGGNIALLWHLVNIPEESRLLVLAWLGECLRPDTPFPLLELMGEQGSAKSTTQSVLRSLIDPNACNLRAMPKAVEDIFVAAGVSWLVSYENISHLSPPMQDALCILATGGGFAKRKLYSDAEESVITVKRPVVLNGISAAVTAQDLIDRTVSIETPIVGARWEITELWKAFDMAHGQLLGGLLDVMAEALARLPEIRLPTSDQPRLVEFARFGMAITEAMGETGTAFMDQFRASRQESIARTIDTSPVATALIEWLESNPSGRTDTPKSLMAEMDRYKPSHSDAWPRTPKGFADALRRAAPALRQMGIECRGLPKTGGVIRWKIKQRESLQNSCPESPEYPVGGDE